MLIRPIDFAWPRANHRTSTKALHENLVSGSVLRLNLDWFQMQSSTGETPALQSAWIIILGHRADQNPTRKTHRNSGQGSGRLGPEVNKKDCKIAELIQKKNSRVHKGSHRLGHDNLRLSTTLKVSPTMAAYWGGIPSLGYLNLVSIGDNTQTSSPSVKTNSAGTAICLF